MGHHDRRAGYLAPLTLFGIFPARWMAPGTPDPGWDAFRAGTAVALRPRLAPPGGAPVRLSGCWGHRGWLPVARACWPGVARLLANRPAGEDLGAIADRTLSWKCCLGNRADDVAAKMIPGRRPRRCEINVLAGTRGLATRTPLPIGLISRSPQITPSRVMPGWCAQRPGAATFDDSDNRIPAAAGPGKPARTRNQTKVRA